MLSLCYSCSLSTILKINHVCNFKAIIKSFLNIYQLITVMLLVVIYLAVPSNMNFQRLSMHDLKTETHYRLYNRFFFFLKFWKFLFYIQRVLFPPKVDVLDEPSKEVQLVQLNEADVLRILAETLAAHIEAVFPDQTVPVWADPARARTLAEFSWIVPVELLVTNVAFSAATR